jgi:hypothetical protein
VHDVVHCSLTKVLFFQVVSRGGFYVGNGINWKGQVFSKMRNHTVTNRMTVRIHYSLFFKLSILVISYSFHVEEQGNNMNIWAI